MKKVALLNSSRFLGVLLRVYPSQDCTEIFVRRHDNRASSFSIDNLNIFVSRIDIKENVSIAAYGQKHQLSKYIIFFREELTQK